MTVLVITHTNSASGVDAVVDAIGRRGARVVRLDADGFPTRARIAVERGGGASRGMLVTGDIELDLREVTAAWFHQTYVGFEIPGGPYKETSVQTSLATLQGVLATLDAFLMDPFGQAEDKQVQLRMADDVGLDIPPTLVTNDPGAVRDFARRFAPLVSKTASESLRLYDEDGYPTHRLFTNEVTDRDLADLGALTLCPMMFQARVPKKVELRAVVVGYDVFTTAVVPPPSGLGAVDRRQGEWEDQRRAYDLPREVEQRLLALMDRLGLNFGAVDFIVTPDDRYVFLEVNANGGGFEANHLAGLPVATAIAELLIGRRRRRPPRPAHLFHVPV